MVWVRKHREVSNLVRPSPVSGHGGERTGRGSAPEQRARNLTYAALGQLLRTSGPKQGLDLHPRNLLDRPESADAELVWGIKQRDGSKGGPCRWYPGTTTSGMVACRLGKSTKAAVTGPARSARGTDAVIVPSRARMPIHPRGASGDSESTTT